MLELVINLALTALAAVLLAIIVLVAVFIATLVREAYIRLGA